MKKLVSAIILAAGRGERFGGDRNKPFVDLDGRSLLAHSVERVRASEVVTECVVVVSAADLEQHGDRLRSEIAAMGVDHVVVGGARRQDSSYAGYQACNPEAEIILIHDSVRPFASPELVRKLIEAASEYDAAAPALQSTDSVKEGAGGFLVRSIPRSVVYLTQTPQAFRRPTLGRMFREVERADIDVTDDAEMAEVAGIKVRIVPGERANIKITSQQDLAIAELVHRRLHG